MTSRYCDLRPKALPRSSRYLECRGREDTSASGKNEQEVDAPLQPARKLPDASPGV